MIRRTAPILAAALILTGWWSANRQAAVAVEQRDAAVAALGKLLEHHDRIVGDAIEIAEDSSALAIALRRVPVRVPEVVVMREEASMDEDQGVVVPAAVVVQTPVPVGTVVEVRVMERETKRGPW